jgi:predicted Fe-Mo cluster-binding NifX family protein
MKVAITSEGTTLDANVDPRFGRCKHFIIADSEDGSFEAIDNTQNLNAASGAGIQSAETVVKHGVEAVLTGHCGPKAFRALSAADITVYTGAAGTVRDALEELTTGKLLPAQDADVDGHWV